MIKNLQATSRFKQNFNKLTKEERQLVAEEINFFRDDPFNISLGTHRLKNKFAGFYAFTVLPDLRIIFRFSKPDHTGAILYDIGTHEIYK